MSCSRILNSPRRLLAVFISSLLIILLCAPFVPRARAVRDRQILSQTAEVPLRRSGELLVRFRGGTSEQQKAETANAHGARRKRQLRGESGIEKLELLADQDPESVALQLSTSPAVEFAEPNFLISPNQFSTSNRDDRQVPGMPPTFNNGVGSTFELLGKSLWSPAKSTPVAAPQTSGVQPNDPDFTNQWALSNTGQNGGQYGSDIQAGTAWQTTTGSAATVIAIIDSGIDFTHSDLENN
ncbi:MAG TPA: hypothetical protein VJ023_20315, partial [Pyrinomonadaceae bacterium]|nr:hypothetical protein [Pyrinomonadaceae bacterium]